MIELIALSGMEEVIGNILTIVLIIAVLGAGIGGGISMGYLICTCKR